MRFASPKISCNLRLKTLLLVTGFFLPDILLAESCSTILGNLFINSNREFTLFVKNEQGLHEAGSGELMRSASFNELEFRYTVTEGTVRPSGRVKLVYLKACRFQLTVSGVPGSPERSEIVEADPLFISGGMLHFFFDQRKRFFQIDRKGKETRMVTEYGLILFRPRPGRGS